MNAYLVEMVAVANSAQGVLGISWDSVGWIVGLVLIALLALKELVRAYGDPRSEIWIRKSNFAIVPLLFLFGVAILGRFLPLLLMS